MSVNDTTTDPRSPVRIAAAETYRRGRELRLTADSPVNARNRLRPRQAFDAGVRAPEEQDEQFRRLQTLGVDEALEWIRKYTAPYDMQPKQWRRRVVASGHILRWMLRFPGDTWDERWLSSGLDQAPRDGLKELGPVYRNARSSLAPV